MLFLVLSIICSVTVGVFFKIAQKYLVPPSQIVTLNYVFALFFCYIFFRPDLNLMNSELPWGVLIPLGVLLPTVFIFLALSIKHMGIVKTDAAQRLSLLISLFGAYFLFKEEFNNLKTIALVIGFLALLLILNKPTEATKNKWVYPAIVWVGFGTIDLLFKQIAIHSTVPFTTSLFIIFSIALVIMLIYNGYLYFSAQNPLQAKSFLFGGLVGLFNFGNILFYLKAHRVFADNPSTVFAGMNIGVILLGSLVGIFIFKEKISRKNSIGLILAVLAIVFLWFSK